MRTLAVTLPGSNRTTYHAFTLASHAASILRTIARALGVSPYALDWAIVA